MEARLEEIVLADHRIQDLIRDRDYILEVDDHKIRIKEYSLAVGCRFKEGGLDQWEEWMHGGQIDESLITEYVGDLYIHVGETRGSYAISINLEAGSVEEVRLVKKAEVSGPTIPELTKEEKERGIEIGLDDSCVQEVLAGKTYEIAPEGKLGVWHASKELSPDLRKIGMFFVIVFDKPYAMDYWWPTILPSDEDPPVFPYYKEGTYHFVGETQAIGIVVDLYEEKVVGIHRDPYIPKVD